MNGWTTPDTDVGLTVQLMLGKSVEVCRKYAGCERSPRDHTE